MIVLLPVWSLLGALIGVAAAQRKGFSVVGGVIGGLLLGPLAFLMFFVSGISASAPNNRKCPSCAEWIKAEATVCKHCHRAVTPRSMTNLEDAAKYYGVTSSGDRK